MQHYGDNFIPVIPRDTINLHPDDNPFCSIDPSCPCHEDQQRISVVYDQVQQGLLTPLEGRRTVEGRML
jgi:hypothetical protein